MRNDWKRVRRCFIPLIAAVVFLFSSFVGKNSRVLAGPTESFGQVTQKNDPLTELGLRKLTNDEFVVIEQKTGKQSKDRASAAFLLKSGQMYRVESDQNMTASIVEGSDTSPVYVPQSAAGSIHAYSELDDPNAKVDPSIQRKFKDQTTVPVIIRLNMSFNRFYEPGQNADRVSQKRTEFSNAKSKLSNVLGAECTITSNLEIINGVAATVKINAIGKLSQSPDVKKVELDKEVKVVLDTSLGDIYAKEVWQLFDANNNPLTGKGKRIAIVDTGVDYHQPAFGSCAGIGSSCKVVAGYDFVNNDTDPMDDNGHGTHVAATAAGKDVVAGVQLYGVAPDANILAYKVCNSGGSCASSALIAAINKATDPNGDGKSDDHADVGSMSLGGGGNPDDAQSLAVDNSSATGVVWTIAAGNSGPSSATVMSPGTARSAITVAAACKTAQIGTNSYCTGPIASFSSRGPLIWNGVDIQKPDVAAPGVFICAARWDSAFSTASTCFDTAHIRISGTSMATPHVAGAVALVRQAHPDYTPAQVKDLLKSSARNLGVSYNDQGAGEINLKAAIPVSTQLTVSPPSWTATTDPSHKLSAHSQSFSIKATNPALSSLSVGFNLSAPGITTNLSKTTVSVANGATDTFTATIAVDNDVAKFGSYVGSIVLSESGTTKGIIYTNILVNPTYTVSPTTEIDYGVDDPTLATWTSSPQPLTIKNLRTDSPINVNVQSSTYPTGISYQITPTAIAVAAGGTGSVSTHFIVTNAGLVNNIYHGTVTVSTQTGTVSIPVKFEKLFKLVIQDANTTDLAGAYGLVGALNKGFVMIPSNTSPKIVYLTSSGTYNLLLHYPATGYAAYLLLKENISIAQGVTTVNVSRSEIKNKVTVVATDSNGVTYNSTTDANKQLHTQSQIMYGPGFSETMISMCVGGGLCDMSTNYFSNISTAWLAEEYYYTPSFQAEEKLHFYWANLSGLSSNLTVTNTAKDFPLPITLKLDVDAQSGTLQPLTLGGAGAFSLSTKLLNIPITQYVYSLLPQDALHDFFQYDIFPSFINHSPYWSFGTPYKRYYFVNGTNSPYSPASVVLPDPSDRTIYNGLGPSFYFMKMANQTTSVNFWPYYYAQWYTYNNAFVRQDYTIKKFADTPYTLYQNNQLVASGTFRFGTDPPYTSTVPAGLTQLRVDTFSYMNKGMSLTGKVLANFDTSLADPNPPAFKRLYYYANNARSEVYDPAVANRVEFELDPVGGTMGAVTVNYSASGGTMSPATVTLANGVYTASIPSVSGLTKMTLQITGADSSGNSLSYTFELPVGTAPPPPNITGTPTPTPSSAPTPAGKPGDANGDGKVDETDYGIWLAHFGQTVTGGVSVGDFNTDGKVDGIDFSIWTTHYGS